MLLFGCLFTYEDLSDCLCPYIEQRTLRSISCRADMLPTNFFNLYTNNHLPPRAAAVFNNCLWLLSTNVLKENAVHSRQFLLVFFLLIPYLSPITKDNRNDFQNFQALG